MTALGLAACTTGDTEETEDTNDTDTTDPTTFGEPNEAMGEAFALTLPGTADAAIDPETDEDWYSFEASADVTVAITEVSETLELYIDVKDGVGDAVVSWDTGDRGALFSETLTITESDTYHLRVHSAYGNDTGTYTLEVE